MPNYTIQLGTYLNIIYFYIYMLDAYLHKSTKYLVQASASACEHRISFQHLTIDPNVNCKTSMTFIQNFFFANLRCSALNLQLFYHFIKRTTPAASRKDRKPGILGSRLG